MHITINSIIYIIYKKVEGTPPYVLYMTQIDTTENYKSISQLFLLEMGCIILIF